MALDIPAGVATCMWHRWSRLVFRSLDLRAQKFKERIRLAVDATGQLDLLYHLIGCVIQLLFRGDDTEQIDDKCQQDNGDKDEEHRGEIVGLTSLALHCPAVFCRKV